jgi:chorismate mutase
MDDRLRRITAALEEADRQIVGALNARARAIHEYNALRDAAGDEPLRLPKKANIIEGARALAEEFPADSIEPVFREVLSACTELTTLASAHPSPSRVFSRPCSMATQPSE